MARRLMPEVQLTVPADESFVQVVTSFVENTSSALGLGRGEALGLTLAAEEVFVHLCRMVLSKGANVAVRCFSGGYYVQADFSFPADELDMRGFNITATVALTDNSDSDQMGLILASRSVDQFRVTRRAGQGLQLSLVKEKAYPQIETPSQLGATQLRSFSVRPPNPEELSLFALLANVHYESRLLPNELAHPGRLIDMVAGGEYTAAVAAGPKGELGGGTLWRWTGPQAVECFGPYVFDQDQASAIASALIESCIGDLARSSAVVLINRFPTHEFITEQFEHLGSVTTYGKDCSPTPHDAWFRLMGDDAGSPAWVHSEIQDFVRQQYQRLFLPRDVRVVVQAGERCSLHSVLFSAFDRLQGSVMLYPTWFGEDFGKNLAQHLRFFDKEQIANVFFVMDLGQSWQSGFAPGLLQNGFKPRMVIPYSGTGDLLMFQLERVLP
ncbi:MAG: hypothetical protein AB9866_09940 [Syntrophobacteraceae bacterium]